MHRKSRWNTIGFFFSINPRKELVHSWISIVGCTSYYEGTELKANHNAFVSFLVFALVVLAITKVLNA